MIVSILLILGFCLFHKAENATITPTFSGMTCPSNWAVGLTSLQIDITDPATAVTAPAEVTLMYQTTTTKTCVLDVQEANCAKKDSSCTDMPFDTVTCTKANVGDPLAISFTTPALAIADHNAMISVTADANFADYADGQHALQVIYGPKTLDSNSETDSAVYEYDQEATFSCSTGFTGNTFTRILSACGEWTKRDSDADNGCTAITCTSTCTNCKYTDETAIDATLAYNDPKEVSCAEGFHGDPVVVTCTTPGPITVGITCTAITCTSSCSNCKYTDGTAIDATLAYNDAKEVSCAEGFHGDPVSVTCTAQGPINVGITCTAITCTSSCANCKYTDETDIGETLAHNEAKEVSCADGYDGDPVDVTCTTQGPITVGITCTAITCTSSCTNCKYTDETAIDANLAYNDEKEVSCVEGFHGDPVDVTCTTQGEIAVGITCTAITCTISCDGCGYVDGSDIGTVLNYNDEKEVNCIAGTATPVSVTCTEQGSISVNIDCGTGSAGSFSSPWSTLIPVLLVYLIMDFLS